ncbi:MAG: MFS transporter [Actinomycetes bacterium]
MAGSTRRSLIALVVGNILGGVGVAAVFAVGTLLVASMGGPALAGLGMALSVLGAGVAGVPLATLAARRGRRPALALGHAVAFTGAALVLVGAVVGSLAPLFVGLLLTGTAVTANLQSRYAAAELVEPSRRGTTMSVVIWATTIGTVLGPNLIAPGADLALALGIPSLAGPFVFSLAAFGLASIGVFALYSPSVHASAASSATLGRPHVRGALPALRWAMGRPVIRFSVVLLVLANMVMIGIMSMTPVHLDHSGHALTVVGLVLSLHVLGMFAFSPVFGWLADRVGPMPTALFGLVVLGVAAATAFIGGAVLPLTMVALFLLGLGWSASTIAASVLIGSVEASDVRVPLQGAGDALMNYGGATAALASGLVLASVGFAGLALVAGVLVVPAALVGAVAERARRAAASSVGVGG